MADLTMKELYGGSEPHNTRATRWDRTLWKIVMNIALLIAVAAPVLAFVNFSYHVERRYSKDGWEPAQFSVEFGLPTQAEVRLNPETLESNMGDKLPKNVTAHAVSAYAPLVNPGWKEQILLRVALVPIPLLILFIVWMLRKIVLTTVGDKASEGNPFIRPNVSRLRWIALAIVLMPFVRYVSEWARFDLSLSAMKDFLWMGNYSLPLFNPMPLAVGLLIFALAEVFAAGIRLREDVEGLV